MVRLRIGIIVQSLQMQIHIKLYKAQCPINYIHLKRLRWAGHIITMEEGRTPRNALEGDFDGKGREWEETVKKKQRTYWREEMIKRGQRTNMR